MPFITRSYNFTDGEVAYGSQVESEIANIVNTLNSADQGNTTWSNVKVTTLTPTANIDFQGYKITNLGSPNTSGDAARYPITSSQIEDGTITGTDIASTTITAGNIASGTITTTQISGTAGITGAQLASSVALAGSPTTTTQSASDNSTKIATTAYADTATKYVLLGTASASSSSSISFTGLAGASYTAFEIFVDNVIPSTDNVDLAMTISTGSGFLVTGYNYENARFANNAVSADGASGSTAWGINGTIEHLGTNTNETFSARITLHSVSSVGALKYANWVSSGKMATGSYIGNTGAGEVDTNSAVVDGIRFVMSSGNIASGTFRLYGIKNS